MACGSAGRWRGRTLKACGIPVSVRIGPDGIDARSGCPAPGPCPHAVAVALAWVRTGEDEQVTDLFEALRALDRDWLARQLAELAAGDPVLSARLARVQDLHLDACLAGSPDPAWLAGRLFRGALESGWGSFGDALPGYAGVLGAAGMARYEELLAHATGPAGKLRAMRESLACARGGTDAVVGHARPAGEAGLP